MKQKVLFFLKKESLISSREDLIFFTRKYCDIKWNYYDIKQASPIVSKESNKVPNGGPQILSNCICLWVSGGVYIMYFKLESLSLTFSLSFK